MLQERAETNGAVALSNAVRDLFGLKIELARTTDRGGGGERAKRVGETLRQGQEAEKIVTLRCCQPTTCKNAAPKPAEESSAGSNTARRARRCDCAKSNPKRNKRNQGKKRGVAVAAAGR